MMLRSDVETIAGWVGNGSKVLDLGCGSGDLLAKLSLEKGIDGVGVHTMHSPVVSTRPFCGPWPRGGGVLA